MTFQLPRVGSKTDPLRLAVLISGSGSGMAALLKYQSKGVCHTTNIVISNIEGVAGLSKAQAAGVEAVALPHTDYEQRIDHEKELDALLQESNIEAIILSGYMRLLTPWFVEKWEGRLINIHPSLLPLFPGAHAHRDALAAGATISGCTVHFVDTGVDNGEIIAQGEIPVLPGDDIESLQARVKMVEHILYPQAIDAFAEGEFRTD
jgi:phosphoribosylglycinamide formyltransferase-1